MSSVIELNSVTKRFRKHFWTRPVDAVRDLSFSVDSPSVVGFVGPNGAGKTTSIKMILGLLHPTSGEVSLRGIPASRPEARRGVAYVSEQPYFYRYLTGRESLRFIYDLLHPSSHNRSKEIDSVLEKTGLTDAAQRRIADYSKGMLQRLNMAQALLGNPDIYVLDEPMSGMDPAGRRLFRSIIRELGEAGKCVFFSSHVLSDVEALCDSVIALSRGVVVHRGDLEALLSGGRLGTDIEISAPIRLREVLERRGCSISVSGETIQHVFVPPNTTIGDVLKLLSDADVYPSAVRPRERSLEDVLFSREQSAEV